MKFPPDPPFVLLEDSQATSKHKAGLFFTNPVEIIQCSALNKVHKTLQNIEERQKEGFFLAGWISYEVGTAFHPSLKTSNQKTSEEPLIWMGVFNKPQHLSSQQLSALFKDLRQKKPGAGFMASPKSQESRPEFNQAFKSILDFIKAGDVYQVNHTFRLALKTYGPFSALYANLRNSQPAPYSALINTGDWWILSFSPELFISKQGQTLISRPMKGTAKPGINEVENKKRMKALGRDEKNRAENLMITDLIRNDFSRITKPGSVKVPKLFEVERFKTVLQMSSEVVGTLKKKTTFLEIFTALFPCGSITGAPKALEVEGATLLALPEQGDIEIFGEINSSGQISQKSRGTVSARLFATEPTAIGIKENLGPYMAGDILIFEKNGKGAKSFLGKECLVQHENGTFYFALVMGGTNDKTFSLAPVGQKVGILENQKIAEASPIVALVRKFD